MATAANKKDGGAHRGTDREGDGVDLKPGRYRHFKGKFYEVIGCARHSETEEEMAVYRDDQGRMWVRPLAMFCEAVSAGGATVPRFSYVGPADPG